MKEGINMELLESLSFKRKLQLGCSIIIALFSIASFLLLISAGGSLWSGLITLIILIAICIPLINLLEKTLTEPIENISRVALNIAKGDFTQKTTVTSNDALGE